MPPRCSIVGCGAIKSPNLPNVSFHRLPRNQEKKRMWLNTIGNENLTSDTKDTFICSVHFEEKSFNRTLGVVRLRDDAVPSLCKQEFSTPAQSPALTPIEINEPSGSLQNSVLDQALKENKILQEKVASQKRTIKCLKEIVRRQKIKLKSSKPIIKKHNGKSLKSNDNAIKEIVRRQKIKLKSSKPIIKKHNAKSLKSNDNAIVMDQCAEPKDFLTRLISETWPKRMHEHDLYLIIIQ